MKHLMLLSVLGLLPVTCNCQFLTRDIPYPIADQEIDATTPRPSARVKFTELAFNRDESTAVATLAVLRIKERKKEDVAGTHAFSRASDNIPVEVFKTESNIAARFIETGIDEQGANALEFWADSNAGNRVFESVEALRPNTLHDFVSKRAFAIDDSSFVYGPPHTVTHAGSKGSY